MIYCFSDHANTDWNTCSDENNLPQLRQVSCAALACLLKHTGLFTYAAKNKSVLYYKVYVIYLFFTYVTCHEI